MWGVSIVNLVPPVTNAPTPLTPSGYIYLKYPTFTWTKVPGATSYNVQVYTSTGLVTNKIVYSSACGTTQCSAVIGPLPYVSQYYWKVNAYSGGWGAWSIDKYFTRLNPIPTLVSPSGNISIINPQFQWKPISGATNYNIELYRNSALYTSTTVTNSACSSTICQVRLSNNLPFGSYYWRVKVYIEGSWNTFSSYMYFTRVAPPPVLISPSGITYFVYPTFTWSRIEGATSYSVQVYTNNSLVINKTVTSSVCGTTYCSVVIGPLPYISQYTWRVNSYVGGWQTWSNYKNFTRLNPIPTLIAPSGQITIPNPQFQWKPITGATNYNIELYRNSALHTSMTLTNSACSSTICQVRLSNDLPVGSYFWRVKVYIEGSWKPFSPFTYFTRPQPAPVLVSPSGTISVVNPLFRWYPSPEATNYNIELYRNSSLYTYMTLPKTACSSAICQVRLSDNLPLGNYLWRVKAYGSCSWGPFSPYKRFTLLLPTNLLNNEPKGYITSSNLKDN